MYDGFSCNVYQKTINVPYPLFCSHICNRFFFCFLFFVFHSMFLLRNVLGFFFLVLFVLPRSIKVEKSEKCFKSFFLLLAIVFLYFLYFMLCFFCLHFMFTMTNVVNAFWHLKFAGFLFLFGNFPWFVWNKMCDIQMKDVESVFSK